MLNYLFTVQYDRFVWIFNNMFNTKVKDAVTIFLSSFYLSLILPVHKM